MDEISVGTAGEAPHDGNGRVEIPARVQDNLIFEHQPVVDAVIGACYGLDRMLRQEAMRQFAAANLDETVRLFLNLDPRSFKSPDYRPGETAQAAARPGRHRRHRPRRPETLLPDVDRVVRRAAPDRWRNIETPTVEELARLTLTVKKEAKSRDDGLAMVCPVSFPGRRPAAGGTSA